MTADFEGRRGARSAVPPAIAALLRVEPILVTLQAPLANPRRRLGELHPAKPLDQPLLGGHVDVVLGGGVDPIGLAAARLRVLLRFTSPASPQGHGLPVHNGGLPVLAAILTTARASIWRISIAVFIHIEQRVSRLGRDTVITGRRRAPVTNGSARALLGE